MADSEQMRSRLSSRKANQTRPVNGPVPQARAEWPVAQAANKVAEAARKPAPAIIDNWNGEI